MVLLDICRDCIIDSLCKAKLFECNSYTKKETTDENCRCSHYHSHQIENQREQITYNYRLPDAEFGGDFAAKKCANSLSKCTNKHERRNHIDNLPFTLLSTPSKLHIEDKTDLSRLTNDPATLKCRRKAPNQRKSNNISMVNLHVGLEDVGLDILRGKFES